MLAMDWAENKSPHELQQFDFVFLIALKNVSKNIPLEEVILQQHGRMKTMGVTKEQIRSFIRQKRVLILLDEYDEYKKGTNTDIDNAITETLGNCFVLVTSRPGEYMKKSDKDQMDGEVVITGFSKEAIWECSTRYLESTEKSKDFLQKCEKSKVDDMDRLYYWCCAFCTMQRKVYQREKQTLCLASLKCTSTEQGGDFQR